MRNILILSLALSAVTAGLAYALDAYELEPIVVTSSRVASSRSQRTRPVAIVDDRALRQSSHTALSDTLNAVGGIDIRRRGYGGVQSDINIRGTTFEQNMVLIDGVRMNDPQTGHHTMDIPLTEMDIERVEIVNGPASHLYGPNAFGGVINIIPKRPSGKAVVLGTEGGSNDYYRGACSVTHPIGIADNRFSFEEARSTGYMPETEFDTLYLSNMTSLAAAGGEYDLLFGYAKKDFGADSFYSNLYPNEEEHTDTRVFTIRGSQDLGGIKAEPKLFLKRHRDKFILDRNRPGWQTNYHTTYAYGGEIAILMDSPLADIAYGFELSRDSIDSTNIQLHRRTTEGVFFEIAPHLGDKLYVTIGLREDRFSDFGWEHSPSAGIGYAVSDNVNVRASAGRAYRVPTFTDLYYNDVANIGNAGLRPESSWSYETGADLYTPLVKVSGTVFHRDSFKTIDWTRSTSKERWRASNIGSIDTNGLELFLRSYPRKISPSFPAESFFLTYTAVDSYRKHDYLSKYALDYLKQHLAGGIEFDIGGFKNSWVANFKKRVGDSGYMVVDTKVSKKIFQKPRVSFEIFLAVSNMFDISYSEQSDIPMPGRRVTSGARLEF